VNQPTVNGHRAEQPRLFHCSHCRTVLGNCTSRLLQVGTAILDVKVDVTCVRCGRKTVWFPQPQKKNQESGE
jgi:RNase P subunit RPR2